MTRIAVLLSGLVLLILPLLVPVPSLAGAGDIASGEADVEGPFLDITKETHFIENRGQWSDEFRFVGPTGYGAVGLGADSVYFNIHIDEDLSQVVRYSFEGTNGPSITASDRQGHVSNFFLGNEPSIWVSCVPSFDIVMYNDLWDGISLRYINGDDGLKYEFQMESLADPSDISFSIDGAETEVEDTELRVLLVNDVTLQDTGLVVNYADGEREEIDAYYYQKESGSIGIELGEYDRDRPVIIDPFILISTFIGSSTSSDDNGGNFVRDEAGNIYSVGLTSSSTFPTTTGIYDTSANGNDDLVIFKMNASLDKLVYSTYLGGSRTDMGGAIALGSNGSIYLGSLTFSSDFPTSSDAYDKTYQPSPGIAGESDAAITRLDDNCTKLGFSTYLGMAGNETISNIFVDSTGDPLVLGTTQASTFPVTSDAYDSTFNGGDSDIFITRLNSSGDKLLYSTFLGGNSADYSYASCSVGDDLVYMTGLTRSSDFPTTSGAYDTTFNGGTGGYNSYVLRFNISSSAVELSTFVGVSYGTGLKVEDNGVVHMVGQTTDSNHPTTSDAYDTTRNGQEDGIYVVLSADMSQLLYSTFVGGSAWDSFTSVDISDEGSAFILGRSRSSNYPTTAGCYDSTYGGGWDIIVTRFSPDRKRLIYSTYLGGSSDDEPGRIYNDDANNATISVITDSSTYPTTTGVYDTTHNGGSDIAFSKIDLTLVKVPPLVPINLTGVLTGTTLDLKWEPPKDDGGTTITHYDVYRGIKPTNVARIDTTTDLFYRDTDLDLRETYYYTVSAWNQIGESPRHLIKSFHETEPPVLNGDLTPNDLLPGTMVTFMVNITDNVEVQSVNVEYWFDDGHHSNETMDNITIDDIWEYTIPLQDSNYIIFYKYYAVDLKGNGLGTSTFSRDVSGEYLPVLWNDRSPRYATPGSEIIFSIDVSDNHEIYEVRLHSSYQESELSTSKMQMVEGTDTYTFTKKMSGSPGSYYRYYFEAIDNDLNRNETMMSSISLFDWTPPRFLLDRTKYRPLDDRVDFEVDIKDDVGVKDAVVKYWLDGGPTETEQLKKSGGVWSESLIVPSETRAIHYLFKATDTSGNTNWTETFNIIIPEPYGELLLVDDSDPTGFSGMPFTFRIRTSFELDQDTFSGDYSINDGPRENISLVRTYGVYTAVLDIPSNVIGYLSYDLYFLDPDNNTVKVSDHDKPIYDPIPPTIEPIDDLTAYVGDEIFIEANASDNVGIARVQWSGSPINSNTLELRGTQDSAGTWMITVKVSDEASLTATTGFLMTILPADNDADRDGIPDKVENDNQLDMNDPSDGLLDSDGDGLANWFEYDLGLDMTRTDSDGDGMPDDWEWENGLDYLRASDVNDEDDDGFTDLEEYQAGTDPRVSNEVVKETEEYDPTLLILLLIIAIIVVMAVWGFAILRMTRKEKVEVIPPKNKGTFDDELDRMISELPQKTASEPPRTTEGAVPLEETSNPEEYDPNEMGLHGPPDLPTEEQVLPDEGTGDQFRNEEPKMEATQ